MTQTRTCSVRLVLALMGIAFSLPASASTHTGTVSLLELWPNGNVVFTLSGTTLPCLGQAVINQSTSGVKNMYAALLTAKVSGRTVQVNTSTCAPADGYNPAVFYAKVDYLYLN